MANLALLRDAASDDLVDEGFEARARLVDALRVLAGRRLERVTVEPHRRRLAARESVRARRGAGEVAVDACGSERWEESVPSKTQVLLQPSTSVAAAMEEDERRTRRTANRNNHMSKVNSLFCSPLCT